MKELLRSVIFDQQLEQWNEGFIRRQISDAVMQGEEIVVISGIRRCGKSTLLNQIRYFHEEKDYYLNFDDERLIHFRVDDFQLLYETFIELFGMQQTFYFDEIQNVPGWERFVRRLHDQRNKVYLTGSNATMLSLELGTHLTGRYVTIELYPFSFREFLQFKGQPVSAKELSATSGRATLQRLFSEYLTQGGFPSYLKSGNSEYLKSLFESILYRDVMVRNRLTGERELLELVNYLASNLSRPVSFNALAGITGVKNATTIKNYLYFLQNSYLLFLVSKFDFALKKQIQNAKKIYFIDNALVKRIGFTFSGELGRYLENLVFIELKRRSAEIFYYHDRLECDFIERKGIGVHSAIQVCYTLDGAETRNREVAGLKAAMEHFNLPTGMILTNDQEETITAGDKKISVIPVWKWLLKEQAGKLIYD